MSHPTHTPCPAPSITHAAEDPAAAIVAVPAENPVVLDSTAAQVRFHLKGEPQGSGPVYQGQEISIPCLNCGRK